MQNNLKIIAAGILESVPSRDELQVSITELSHQRSGAAHGMGCLHWLGSTAFHGRQNFKFCITYSITSIGDCEGALTLK